MFEYQLISNSLIILNEKTIKITTVMVVWISVTNYHKILQNLSLNFCKNYCSFGKLYQKLHLRSVSSISRHLKVGLKKHGCASYFSPLLSVWISDETLRVVFMYYVKYLSFSFLIRQLHFFQVNPNIKFEVFIHKVDGLSDDHKIGGFNLLLTLYM